jgi:hypothetical protein
MDLGLSSKRLSKDYYCAFKGPILDPLLKQMKPVESKGFSQRYVYSSESLGFHRQEF